MKNNKFGNTNASEYEVSQESTSALENEMAQKSKRNTGESAIPLFLIAFAYFLLLMLGLFEQ